MKPKHNKFSIMLKRNSINVHLLTRQRGLEIGCLSLVRTRPAGRIGNFLFKAKTTLLVLWIFTSNISPYFAEFAGIKLKIISAR